jgi:hypothetical protein
LVPCPGQLHEPFAGNEGVTLDDLAADDPSAALAMLRDLFVAPEEFRPRIEPAQITEKAARHFAEIPRAFAHAVTTRRRSPSSWSARCRLLDGDP